MALLLLLIPAVILVLLEVSRHASFRRRLETLATGLEGGEAHASFFGGPSGRFVQGRLGGRWVHVSFTPRSVRLTTEVQHPPASFQVQQAQLLDQLGRWLGLSKTLVDPRLALRAGDPSAVKLLQATEVHAALRQLFRHEGVVTVTLDGQLTAVHVQNRPQAALDFRAALEALVALARVCDRRPVERAGASLRFVWTGGAAAARCPYCRAELDPAATEGILACDRCGTLHHADCLVEAGGCTVFGCGARDGQHGGK